MYCLLVSLAGQPVEIRCPADIANCLGETVPAREGELQKPKHWIAAEPDSSGELFQLTSSQGVFRTNLAPSVLPGAILQALAKIHSSLISDALALRGSAFAIHDSAILVAETEEAEGGVLTPWLLDRGYTLTGSGMIAFGDNASVLETTYTASSDDKADPPITLEDPVTPKRSKAILFPVLAPDADLRIEVLPPAETAMMLLRCCGNTINLPVGGFRLAEFLAGNVPGILVQFASHDALDGRLDTLLNVIFSENLDVPALTHLSSALVANTSGGSEGMSRVRAFPKPAPTPRQERKPLTIGMATYDDYDGVYFSLQSLRIHHREILDDVEFLIIDNNPTGVCSGPLKALEKSADNVRYVPFDSGTGTAASRDLIFEEASGDLVIVMDCHVLLVPNAVARLLNHYRNNPTSNDLLQGPLLKENMTTLYTHMKPTWASGMFGEWGHDSRGENIDAEPFEIPMQGLGLFSCRREAWPGFNLEFSGFGGEEGYIHEKFRQRGDRTLCLPFFRWMHRFARPLGIPYPIVWADRIRNYLIGFTELGLPTDPIFDHFKEIVGEDETHRVANAVTAEIEARKGQN